MNERILKRLINNPHYKMNKDQKIGLSEIKKKPMIQFGEPNLHNNEFAKHDVSVVKKREKYENKKTKNQKK
jgi:hypothetical protein